MTADTRQSQPAGSYYASLLKSLSSNHGVTHPSKKRKLNRPNLFETAITFVDPTAEEQYPELQQTDATSDEVSTDGWEIKPGQPELTPHAIAEAESDEEEDQLLKDPFEQHYVSAVADDLKQADSIANAPAAKPATKILADGIKKTWTLQTDEGRQPRSLKGSQDLYLKQRLQKRGEELFYSSGPLEKDLASTITSYHDVIFNSRTLENVSRVRDLCVLHSLNHVFKTRDRVLKNNAKLSQAENPEELDVRDQGFTRPKILVVLPTKQSCVRFVESVVKLSDPEQLENKSRFMETFSQDDDDEWQEKPADFQELFGGNHEEDFRIGLKFTRKTIKYFSGFYNSDIIIGSPLGLMRSINSGGKKDEANKGPDADFLSSIEVVIVDHVNALQMQNWQHVEYVFSQLNQLPKDSHGCDFSRVRSWYLDGHAKRLRQTILISSYLTPEINALASSHLHSIAGRVKYMPTYSGAMTEVPKTLPLAVNQTFIRFDSKTPASDGDERFKHFITATLPLLTRDENAQGILVFVPTYADFVRLRNHLDNAAESSSIPFGCISEYTPVRDIARARSHFLSGRHRLLLYSERAHHHFRYRIRGVRKVVFYGAPENPTFWTEIVGLLGMNAEAIQSISKSGKGLVRALFSKWDILKLERIVGTERVGRLVSERAGDTFDFA